MTISAFARAVELAPSTLRYYDEAGLLAPAEVDARTGYRYYTPELVRRAGMIRRMRDIGVPVEAMREVLAGTPERAAHILGEFAERAARNARQAYATVDEILAVLQAPTTAPDVAVTTNGPELAAALRKVSRAASENETPLNGVLLEVAKGAITAVATDRYWLAYWSIPVAESQATERRIFVSRSALDALTDRLDHGDEVTLGLGAKGATISDDSETAPVETADDRFPAYRLIVPRQEERTGRLTFDRGALAALLPGDDDRPVRLAVGKERAGVARLGESESTGLQAITSGTPTTLWFPANVLRQALDTMVGDTVSLVYAAQDRPVQLVPVEQSRLRVLLMPSRPQA
ncbi:MerR family transcriptional regulator [Flindersiella endophytica]